VIGSRVLFIGLDGATYTVLDPLMRDGTMPFLRDFIAGGARAVLRSTPQPLTPPAWTSIMTGRTPGNHGIFDFMWPVYQDDKLFIKIVDSRDVKCETIWSLLSRLGRRVIALNFPVMFPARPVNGYSISGFTSWRHLRRGTYPPAFYDTLRTIPGVDRKELGMDLDQEKKSIQGLQPAEYEAWINFHLRRERQWFEITRHLMERDPADLTAILFDGADRLQHIAWRLVSPGLQPATPTPWEHAILSLCRRYFADLDSYLAELVKRAGRDGLVVMASDHGFSTSDEIFHVNVFLAQRGYLVWGSGAAEVDGTGQHLPQRMSVQYGLIDWARTKAYCFAPSSNGIYIRVSREPGQPGVPAGEYEAFRRRLIDELLTFGAPDGGRVVTRVMTREEAFPGTESARAPDLTLVLRDHGFVSVLNAPSVLWRRDQPVGGHHPEGVFLAAGPGIRAGVSVPPLDLVDVPAFLLHGMGLAVPADFEGRVPTEILTDEWLRDAPVRVGERTRPVSGYPAGAPREEDLADDEEAAVVSRLKDLGYVE